MEENERSFYMKNLLKKIGFAGLMLFAGASAALAAAPAGAAADMSGICDLIVQMKSVFNLLRTLAFVGAGFIVAGWAWGMIKDGKYDQEDLRKKGTGMLIGFVILFAIGIVLSFLLSSAGGQLMGCKDVITGKW